FGQTSHRKQIIGYKMQETIYKLTDWKRYAETLTNKLQKRFKPFTVEVKMLDAVSREQQCYIFGVIYPHLRQALIDAGYEIENITSDQFDYFMRSMFYFDIVKTTKGETKIPRRLNFGKGKKAEVTAYIEDLLAFGARLGCYIPSPEQPFQTMD
ncbi:MAG: hypothetical protein IIW86_03795, partial [Clostridia bacterium]|nr:hypothetical protein [Clostridia bacterium]